jgi:hypothetical protein
MVHEGQRIAPGAQGQRRQLPWFVHTGADEVGGKVGGPVQVGPVPIGPVAAKGFVPETFPAAPSGPFPAQARKKGVKTRYGSPSGLATVPGSTA